MRLGLIIIMLGAIALALVHIRRTEMAARHETQQLQGVQVRLRRKLWDQQVRLGCLTAPTEVRRRVLALNLIDGGFPPEHLALKE